MDTHVSTHVALYAESSIATGKLAHMGFLASVSVTMDTKRRWSCKSLAALSTVVSMLLRLSGALMMVL